MYLQSLIPLLFTVSGSTDQRLPPVLWWQHRTWTEPSTAVGPQTQVKLLEAAQIMDISLASDGRTDHSGQHSFGGQPRPCPSPWSLVAIQATDINTDPDYSRPLAPEIALGGSMGLEITKGSDSTAGRSHQPGPHCCWVSTSTSLDSGMTAHSASPPSLHHKRVHCSGDARWCSLLEEAFKVLVCRTKQPLALE